MSALPENRETPAAMQTARSHVRSRRRASPAQRSVGHVARWSVAWRCPSWDGCGGSAAAWWGLGNLLTKSMGWVLGIDPRRGRCPLTPLPSAPSSVAPSLSEGRRMMGPRARDREGGIIDKGGRKTPRAGRLFRPRWQSSPGLGGYNSIAAEACGDAHALGRPRWLGSPLVRFAPELETPVPSAGGGFFVFFVSSNGECHLPGREDLPAMRRTRWRAHRPSVVNRYSSST